MLIINEENFQKEVLEAESLVLLDLYADWCGPCRMLAPTVEELEKDYPAVKFGKVNVDTAPNIAMTYHVESIPFIALIKGGELVGQSIGFVPKQVLAALIEKHR